MASHAALTPEDYWNSVLPSTPMPKAISDLLQPEGWYIVQSERPREEMIFNIFSTEVIHFCPHISFIWKLNIEHFRIMENLLSSKFY